MPQITQLWRRFTSKIDPFRNGDVFKHALTQEVAYESLLTTSRQGLHATAAQVLEQVYADRLDDAYDRLAYHYARTDNASKAVTYLTAVADRAARAYAHREAVASYQEAIRHAEQLPEDVRDHRVLDLVIRQGAEQYRSLQVQSWFNTFLAEAFCKAHELDQAYDLASKTFEMTRTIKHWWGVAQSRRVLGQIAQARGNLVNAELCLWEALQTFAAIQSRYEWGRAHLVLASLAAERQDISETTVHLRQAHALFTDLQVPKYVERTVQLARAYGVSLTKVESEALPEGEV